jgi:hypothetical protein
MMRDDAPPAKLIVNWIEIENGLVRLGATDDRRWRWSIEDGGAGGDATSHVLVSLVEPGGAFALEETVQLFCAPDLPERSLVLAQLADLTALAHLVHRLRLLDEEARSRLFGLDVARARASVEVDDP